MNANSRPYHCAAYDFSSEPPSLWRAQTPSRAEGQSSLIGDERADVAVIGAGYTGLHAALRLASTHGANVTVLEAGTVGWGASARNGGFCSMGGAFHGTERIAKQFGEQACAQWTQAQIESVGFVRDFLTSNAIDADTHSDGEWALAHSAAAMKKLRRDGEAYAGDERYRPTIVSKTQLADIGMGAPHFYGAMKHPVGFALNPAKYVDALAAIARRAGVRIVERSEVSRIERAGAEFSLVTADGALRAKRILVATNGYTPEALAPGLHGATLPIMSSIIATRPLQDDELRAQRWTSRNMAYDTRLFLHYFRLLPDNRFLFGMRGGADASPNGLKAIERRTRAHFETLFPAWRDVAHDYFWSGLVCFTRNLTPYAGPIRDWPGAWATFGYHGSGVAMASWAGRQVADVIAGAAPPDAMSAILRQPLRKFPLPQLRRAALKLALGLSDVVEPPPKSQRR